MLVLLSEMGRSFLRAFAGSLIVLLPGLLSAPDLNGAVALGIAALVASVAMGLKAVQVFIPQLTFKSLLPARLAGWGNTVDSFVRAFLGALIVGLTGWLAMPSLDFSKAALTALLVGAITAAFRVLQGLLTSGDVPAPNTGLNVPPPTA
jgi:hypothetical protein